MRQNTPSYARRGRKSSLFEEDKYKRLNLQRLAEAIIEDHDIEVEAEDEKTYCQRIATSWRFELGVWILIILNCLAVWIETSEYAKKLKEDGEKPNYSMVTWIPRISPWLWLQFACLALFVLEVAFKVAVLGRKFFRNVYNWIDLFVLLITIVPWVMSLILSKDYGPGSNAEMAWRKLLILRIVRLFAITKALRRWPIFRELWMLTTGVTYSIKTLIWGLALTFVLLFVFAVFATSMIGFSTDFIPTDAEKGYFNNEDRPYCPDTDDEIACYSAEAKREVRESWGTVTQSMATLFQIMTLDDWMQEIGPVLEEQPGMLLFFIAFIAVSVFALTNLITAVLVESAMQVSREDEKQKEYEAAKEVQKLKKLLVRVLCPESSVQKQDKDKDKPNTRLVIPSLQDAATSPTTAEKAGGAGAASKTGTVKAVMLSVGHFLNPLRKRRPMDSAQTVMRMATKHDASFRKEQLMEVIDRPEIKRLMKIYDVEESDLLGLCDLLTMDEMNNGTGSPEIMVEDFIVGTQKLRGQAKSKDLFELRTRLSAMERNQLNLMEEMARLRSTLRGGSTASLDDKLGPSLRVYNPYATRSTLGSAEGGTPLATTGQTTATDSPIDTQRQLDARSPNSISVPSGLGAPQQAKGLVRRRSLRRRLFSAVVGPRFSLRRPVAPHNHHEEMDEGVAEDSIRARMSDV
ncbi:unnamed protein product [Vitrella brassicaformis CCMP3155]|uniref:Ion transport domain-containing protein n=1 Tax=Vitrella brassicaformis (strain CCMP3155) TaxID=1169540 RepID=A0A0G4EKS2_VITBC|nr:unnamed protein product [Vitrella brassicaformis CCMP3155]|eukprot:CEL97761.1 unnamed protein product [Vitrella brassicaformis CCMP3155]